MRKYGSALKEIRESHGYSQRDLAQRTGIKQQNISRWERDLALPNIDFCVQLAEFYGVTLDELVGRN